MADPTFPIFTFHPPNNPRFYSNEHRQLIMNHRVDPSVLERLTTPVIANPVQLFPSTYHLPPELLQHIFTFLSPASLKSASLASVAFAQLAQPILFSTLSISPLQVLFYSTEPVFRPRWYSEYVRARLQVYVLNDRLRRSVRHVRVSPYPMDSQSEERERSSVTVAPEPIVEALIAALPSFPNLETLSWHCIDILPNWWSAITQLPRLKRLWLNSCTVFPGNVDSAPPSIDTVFDLVLDDQPMDGEESGQISVHEIAHPDRYPGVSGGLLSLVLNPAVIRYISAPRPEAAGRVLHYLSGLDVSCSLRTLKLPAVAMQYRQLYSALLRCEELEELCFLLPPSPLFVSDTWDDDDLGSCCEDVDELSLPHLQRFTGPASLLVALLSSTPALRLTSIDFLPSEIYGNDELSPSDLAHIFVLLANRRGSLRSLQSVKFVTSEMTDELVQALSVFPNLYKLEARFVEQEQLELSKSFVGVQGIADHIERLRIPPRLRQLTIHLPYPTESTPLAASTEREESLLNVLASRYPLLRSISLHLSGDRGLGLNMSWYRSLSANDSDNDTIDEESLSQSVPSVYGPSHAFSPADSQLASSGKGGGITSLMPPACASSSILPPAPTRMSRSISQASLLPRRSRPISRTWTDMPPASPSPLLNLFTPHTYSKWSWFLGNIVVSNY